MKGSIKFNSELYTIASNVSGYVDVFFPKRNDIMNLDLKLVYSCEEILEADVLLMDSKSISSKSITISNFSPANGDKTFKHLTTQHISRSHELAHLEIPLANFRERIPSGEFRLPFTFRIPEGAATSLTFRPSHNTQCQVKNSVSLNLSLNFEQSSILAVSNLRVCLDHPRVRGIEARRVEDVVEVPSSRFLCFGKYDGQFIMQATCDSCMTKKVQQGVIPGSLHINGKSTPVAELKVGVTLVNASKKDVTDLRWRLVSISRLGSLDSGFSSCSANNFTAGLPSTLHASTLLEGHMKVDCPGPKTTVYETLNISFPISNQTSNSNTAVPDYHGKLFGVVHKLEIEVRLRRSRARCKVSLPIRLLGENETHDVSFPLKS
eukprot:GDKJ01051261.1.p1 GENE.GDKJ01051261.1~~GDKJ01051261.1.p1  ORF type:complete len:378 (+),score=60.03 GDKJ01051261.1:141-1274(+)